MFSNSQPQQQPAFNGSAIGFQPGIGFGGGLSTNQQQQTVPGVRIDVANIRGTTRFNDLHEELQKKIEFLDNIIQTQIQLKNDCYAIMPQHEAQLSYIPNDVEFCRRKLIGLDSAVTSDVEAIAHIQKLVKTDAEHAKLSFRAVDNLKLPPQYHVTGVWPAKSTNGDGGSQANGAGEAQDIVGFFSSSADELATTLTKYQKNIGEIELHLRNVEANSAQQVNSLVARRNGASGADEDAVRELAEAFTDFEQGILHVAGKVGGLREGIQSLQLGTFTGPTNAKSPAKKRSGVY